MQVCGLPGHIIRTGKLASRIAAKSSDDEAAIRRAAAARWRRAMANGLTAVLKPQATGPVAIWDGKPKRSSVEHDSVHDEP